MKAKQDSLEYSEKQRRYYEDTTRRKRQPDGVYPLHDLKECVETSRLIAKWLRVKWNWMYEGDE